MIATTSRARDTASDQARAIREHRDSKPQTNAPKESARDARLRMQIERERKTRPMTGGK